jgi:hypothetical protein
MRTLVIKNIWGGLGDHLFYSHLPRVAKETGAYEKVLISDRSQFRNPDYRKLIWEANPYVDGFTSDDGVSPTFDTVPKGMNLLDYTMLQFGLDDGLRFHEPELYYKPTIRPDLKSMTIYDPNYISGVGKLRVDRIQRFLRHEPCKVDLQLKARWSSAVLPDVPEMGTSDVFDFCSIVASCGQFICLTSGGATLAAALRRNAIVFYGSGQPSMFQHSKLHRYVYAGTFFDWALAGSRQVKKMVRQRLSNMCAS